MLGGTTQQSEREPLKAFRALAADLAPRDLQDLMSYPFFSLSKAKRTRPVDYRAGDITIRVEGTTEHGIATIWDADVLIWAASQIIEARDAGIATSRLLVATPYEILGFIGRGTSGREYMGLKAAFDRLQSTTVATSIRQPSSRRLHRFSWINEWKERATGEIRPWHKLGGPQFCVECARSPQCTRSAERLMLKTRSSSQEDAGLYYIAWQIP